MLRAYARQIVDAINACREVNTFIPALAYTFAANPAEVEVEHAERAAGKSKYSLYQLARLNFDLVTGFSLAPLQLFSLFGIVLGMASLSFIAVQVVRRLVLGSAAEGVFDSAFEAVELFMIGMVMIGIGLVGEYVGRIYQEVLRRPRFLVSAVLEEITADPAREAATDRPEPVRRVQ
jgi:undecaprenyl-phosphate 4-deoxy-4-formamido-L-arabinose transferase